MRFAHDYCANVMFYIVYEYKVFKNATIMGFTVTNTCSKLAHILVRRKINMLARNGYGMV